MNRLLLAGALCCALASATTFAGAQSHRYRDNIQRHRAATGYVIPPSAAAVRAQQFRHYPIPTYRTTRRYQAHRVRRHH